MFGPCWTCPLSLCPPANLVFHQTVERIHVGKKFGDIPRGIFIVRGENVVLLGEIVSGARTHTHARTRAPFRRIFFVYAKLGIIIIAMIYSSGKSLEI